MAPSLEIIKKRSIFLLVRNKGKFMTGKSLNVQFLEDRNLKTSQDVGYPIMLDVASNLGFAALLFSSIIPLNYMGGLMVFAMISTSFGTLTILSSIIELMKDKIKV